MVALYSNGEPLDPNDVAFFLEPFGLHLDALEGIERPSDNAVKADRDMKEWYRAAVPRALDKLPDGVRKAVVAELAKPLAALEIPSLQQRVPVASVGAVAHSPAKALPPAPAPQAMLPSFSEDASPALSKRAQSVAKTPLKKVQLSKPAASPTPSSSSSLSSSSSSVESVVRDEAPDPLVALVEPVDEDLIEFEPILPVHHAAERSAKRSRAPDVEEEVVDPEFDQEEESLWSNRSSLSNIMDGLQESFAGISPTGQIALKLLKERVKTDEKLLELGIRKVKLLEKQVALMKNASCIRKKDGSGGGKGAKELHGVVKKLVTDELMRQGCFLESLKPDVLATAAKTVNASLEALKSVAVRVYTQLRHVISEIVRDRVLMLFKGEKEAFTFPVYLSSVKDKEVKASCSF